MITLPTLLTLSRILLIPLLAAAWYSPFAWGSGLAAAIFVICCITDWLDGWVARTFRMESRLGQFLDPVADKLLISTVLLLVVQRDPTPFIGILAGVVIAREIGVSALREWMADHGLGDHTRVNRLGKTKAAVQMAALTSLLLQIDLFGFSMLHVGGGLLLVATILTVWSGAIYLRNAWPTFR